MSRCVRRIHLLGGSTQHRKKWIEQQLRVCAEVFCVDVLSFAIMDNHIHFVVKLQPQQAEQLDPTEVALRWSRLFPSPVNELDARSLAIFAANDVWIEERRARLLSPSWLMKIIKERVARRANREDDMHGAFWEGRFKSIRLLDRSALLACMAYVDLNPIRAGAATTPEKSNFTSVQHRLRARYEQKNSAPWLANFDATVFSHMDSPILLDDYLQMVETSGRMIHPRSKGVIPEKIPPLVERLALHKASWIPFLTSSSASRGTAIGEANCRAREAIRRGAKWVSNMCTLRFKSQTTQNWDDEALSFEDAPNG